MAVHASMRPGCSRPCMCVPWLEKNERRLIGARDRVSAVPYSCELVISGGRTARLSPFLEVLDTAAGPFRKSGMGIVVPAEHAGHVWGASREWCIGAYGDSISVPLGHLIWQLRKPAGLRRRRDWA